MNRALVAFAVLLTGCAQMGGQTKEAPAKPAPQAEAPKPALATSAPAPAPIILQPRMVTPPPAATPRMIEREVSTTQVVPTKPETFRSLQPFRNLGSGEGIAKSYKSRTKAEIIALLRDPVRFAREMRVPCETWVSQIAEAHPGIPFEGCEGAAKAIASDDFQVVACRDEMTLVDNWVVLTNKGSSFNTWNRTCYTGETMLTWKGKITVSTMCFNPLIPKTMTKVIKTKTMVPDPNQPLPATASCKIRDILRINVWQATAMRIPGVASAVAFEATNRDYYAAQTLSRSQGSTLRAQGSRSIIGHQASVRHVKPTGVTKVLWAGSLVGQVDVRLPDDFVQGDIIQEVWADTSRLHSPRLDKRLRWNEFQWCLTNSHTIEK